MSGGKRGRKNQRGEEAEVEELLRATEDQILLNLKVGSHVTSRGSSSNLDPDLARRFDALKSPQTRSPSKDPRPLPSKLIEQPVGDEQEAKKVLGNDLSARFATLKLSAGSNQVFQKSDPVLSIEDRVQEDDDGGGDGDGVSKKEVEKVMQWAMDAARLDPSRSDEEEDDDEDGGDEDLGESEDEKMAEEKSKVKGKPKKWFFF